MSVDSMSDSMSQQAEDSAVDSVLESQSESEEEMDIDEVEPVTTKESLYRPPTSNEMFATKESNLYKSNLFKLQITELLKNITVKTPKALPSALHSIKEWLESMDSVEELSLLQARGMVAPVVIPCDIDSNTLIKFAFVKPLKVAVVGSFLLGTIVKHPDGMNVDLAVEMSPSLFQEKDNLNHRYFAKRAFYLAHIAKLLPLAFPDQFTLRFEAFQNDRNRPVLVISSTPTNTSDYSKKGFVIRILPFVKAGTFLRSRVSPTRNNVRGGVETFPTPHYNSSLMIDSFMTAHLNLLHSHMKESNPLKDAILLMKVWISQRAFGGFNGFLVGMIMAWLMRVDGKSGMKRIGKAASSYQMFKVTMELLATYDFTTKVLFLTDNGKEGGGEGFGTVEFLAGFDVAVVDPTGTINLAFKVTNSDMQEVQYEARMALAFLSDAGNDRFEDLFLKKVDRPWIKYDNIFRIPKLTVAHTSSYTHAAKMDHDSLAEFVVRQLHVVLKAGLTDRTKCIFVSTPRIPTWSITKKRPRGDKISDITIGMVLDPEHSLREVEHGPDSQDLEKVQTFKDLWGQRSEMRRFQDGSIEESVVFECDGSVEQRSVLVARMTAYLLARHFKVDEDDGVTYWAGLGNKYCKSLGNPPSFNSFQSVMDAFQAISKEIKALDLPLAIHRIHSKSDGLSYCSAFIPQPTEMNQLVSRASPPDFVIEFENSGKWPDDVAAIETMKRAFYIRIVGLLEDSESETLATVCIGEGNESFLRFTHTSGHLFKARIHHGRVGYLVTQALKEKSIEPAKKASLLKFQSVYNKNYIYSPVHYNLIGQLCLRFPFLGQTIRLLKRWFASHLLLSGSGIAPEVVEIICIKVYTVPTAFGPPASGWTGFVRALELIESWKWSLDPMVVELEEGTLTDEIREQIETRFGTLSQSGVGHISMFVATEKDPDSLWWKSLDISVKVLQRIILLCRTCINHIRDRLLNGTDNDVSQLFVTPSTGYHAIIHLDCSKLLTYFDSVSFDPSMAAVKTSKFKNVLGSHDKQLIELSLIDPVQMYLRELEKNYGEIAMFFSDIYGGDKIAIVWKAGQMTDTAFKVNMSFNSMPIEQVIDGKGGVSANKTAILAEMQRLGEGLVIGLEL